MLFGLFSHLPRLVLRTKYLPNDDPISKATVVLWFRSYSPHKQGQSSGLLPEPVDSLHSPLKRNLRQEPRLVARRSGREDPAATSHSLPEAAPRLRRQTPARVLTSTQQHKHGDKMGKNTKTAQKMTPALFSEFGDPWTCDPLTVHCQIPWCSTCPGEADLRTPHATAESAPDSPRRESSQRETLSFRR